MKVSWDAEHVVSAATRRQRQMAWVSAVGMSVIPQREREGESRSRRGGEKRLRGFKLCLVIVEVRERGSFSRDSKKIFGAM